jgi:huntingtin
LYFGTELQYCCQVVATDLFTGRSSTTATAANGEELETQREVIVSMLLRCLDHPEVIDTLAKVMTWTRTAACAQEDSSCRDDRARKLSRQILDALLPRLCAHSVQLRSAVHVRQLLQLLRALSPGALRPCDAVMSSLLSCSVELGSMTELTSWLAFTLVTFLVVLQLSPEEAVLGRLQASQQTFFADHCQFCLVIH